MTKINACPFCLSGRVELVSDSMTVPNTGRQFFIHYIECNECLARGSACETESYSPLSAEEAVKSWNNGWTNLVGR